MQIGEWAGPIAGWAVISAIGGWDGPTSNGVSFSNGWVRTVIHIVAYIASVVVWLADPRIDPAATTSCKLILNKLLFTSSEPHPIILACIWSIEINNYPSAVVC